MAKFIPRLTAPSTTDKHYYGRENIFYACGYGMPNCTAYAWGRLYEITGKRYTNLTGNAEDFYDSAIRAGLKVGQTPKLGAIVVWRAGQTHNSADGAGHVAVVEEIKPNGDIVTSNSAWKSTVFYLQTITKASGYIYADTRPLLGFIYCGIEFDEEKPVTPDAPTTESTSENVYYVKKGDTLSAIARNHGTTVAELARINNIANVNEISIGQKIVLPAGAQRPIEAGGKYTLNNVPVYNSGNGSTIGTRSGTYYVWSATPENGRYKMTNSPSRVGIKGQVSFFVDKKYLV